MVAAYNLWTLDAKKEIFNPYSEAERLHIMVVCSFKAVSGGFRHLPIRYIIDPPHGLFDAALARQIAIHILHYQFEVSRRRLVAMQERERTAVARSLRTINRRLEEPVFARAYQRWAGRAMDLFF
ncbi:hypothetical protein KAE70_03145 [Bartonella henselae]|uniref:hypothetical protein n=1 Tax=Bartonella henselae TaxID=38323 RepID=UPI0009666C28|nr:hypothetical protein [Bartonella henselae]OLL54186.1 hypothetical protein AT239_07640 [Bartonella henselae]OLL54230.1 hypothetical protein AT240_08025 [Bartonella henselae]UJM33493.1 hypothetical protein KAE70_03145 [Bartonella henselae]